MRNILIAVALLLPSACLSPTEPDTRWAVPEEIQFAPSLNVDLAAMTRTTSGLYLQDLEVGTGATAVVGSTIRVHYTGWFPDGTMFETTLTDKARCLEYRLSENTCLEISLLGMGTLIRGWDEGLVGMQVGGKRKLVIRPELAYGRNGKGVIPPLATLIFDVELIWVKR
jgi:FKBP-type peptidyl-prolyl cis-trans isomerase FkpA